MIKIVTLNTNREEYDIRDAAARSMTVGQLVDELLTNYDRDDKIVFSNDGGYTYGYVGAGYIDRLRVETKEEEAERERQENLREQMEELRDELEDLKARYQNPGDYIDEDEEPMTYESYLEQCKALFNEYGITEEEYSNFNF